MSSEEGDYSLPLPGDDEGDGDDNHNQEDESHDQVDAALAGRLAAGAFELVVRGTFGANIARTHLAAALGAFLAGQPRAHEIRFSAIQAAAASALETVVQAVCRLAAPR